MNSFALSPEGVTQNPKLVPIESRDMVAVEDLRIENEEVQHAEKGTHGRADHSRVEATGERREDG
jgi:hypothetical protein